MNVYVKKVNDGRYVLDSLDSDMIACADFTEMVIRLTVMFGEDIEIVSRDHERG